MATVSPKPEEYLAAARKSLYVYVGAADLAVETLRTLPTTYASEIKKLSGRVSGLPGQAKVAVDDAAKQAKELTATIQLVVKSVPTKVTGQFNEVAAKATGQFNEVAAKATGQFNDVAGQFKTVPTKVTGQFTEVATKATELYNTIAGRGEKIVGNIRKSPAAEEAAAETKTAVSEVKAVKTSARKAAGSAAKAVAEGVEPKE